MSDVHLVAPSVSGVPDLQLQAAWKNTADSAPAPSAVYSRQIKGSRRDVGVEDFAYHCPLALDFQQLEKVGEADA